MTYPEENLLPISALQHLLFCERQCALIHLERLWADNRYTAEGNHLHRKAHLGKAETRDGVRITRGLPLRSFQLGLVGQADVVHWRPPPGQTLGRVSIIQSIRQATDDQRRLWQINPIEYKRGRPKKNDCDCVQLCAQAMCLEEMLSLVVPRGELFYGQRRRRIAVEFDPSLRSTTSQAALRLHKLIDSGVTPRAVKEKKCDTCSLLSLCMPAAMGPASARGFFQRAVANHLSASGPKTDDVTDKNNVNLSPEA